MGLHVSPPNKGYEPMNANEPSFTVLRHLLTYICDDDYLKHSYHVLMLGGDDFYKLPVKNNKTITATKVKI